MASTELSRTRRRPNANTNASTSKSVTIENVVPITEIISEGEFELIRYYIVDKTGTAQTYVKGAADSVALFLKDKNVRNYIVIKCGKSERIVNLEGMSYNTMVQTLENSWEFTWLILITLKIT